ncbi:hypothetical protein [Acetobacter nitrogenifigens]|uniref:hypothetical protein n=1 Tax=Acetobacter nitrogenifigens TaxID=285268 RepID=UPI0012B66A17|nr:hypothetical protein [Acetobacter nitrogenifigens]
MIGKAKIALSIKAKHRQRRRGRKRNGEAFPERPQGYAYLSDDRQRGDERYGLFDILSQKTTIL